MFPLMTGVCSIYGFDVDTETCEVFLPWRASDRHFRQHLGDPLSQIISHKRMLEPRLFRKLLV